MVGVVVAPADEPATMILYEPTGTEEATSILSVLDTPEEVGVTEAGLNEVHEKPEGRGETHDNPTTSAGLETNVEVTVAVAELPC